MTRLNWDSVGERIYESGVDHGVLYVNNTGVAWPGLVSVSESPSGGEPRPFYVDGFKYLNLSASEEFEATIEAFSAPRAFGQCDGRGMIHTGLIATQQPRKQFDFSYRTKVGNDVDGIDHGYKLHLVYNALAAPSSRSYSTLSDTAEAPVQSWTITTLPPKIVGIRPTAHFVVESLTSTPENLAEVEAMLYGTDGWEPKFPTVEELLGIFDDTFVYDGGVPDDSITSIIDGGVI